MTSLTPAAVMDLRTSLHVRPSDGTFAYLFRPWMMQREDGVWELHAYGKLQALGTGPIIMSAIERERREPGFIADLLNPATDCERVLQPAAEKRAYAANVEALNARLLAEREAAEAAEWRKRRVQQFDPTRVNLSDLD